MVSTVSWILLGIGVYWLTVLWLRNQGFLPAYVGTQGPILTLHTKRFRALIDRIAQPKRLWRAWGNFGIGVAIVVMVGSFVALAFAAVAAVQNPTPSAVNQPRNVLVIPGVNEFLPLSVAPEIVFGLLVGLVVHEGGHAILCRVGDIDIESMGLALFAIVPIGAFVEPDEESRRRADRGDQTRMFAAGVMNNFAITLIAFGLLFGPVMGVIGVAPGAAVGGVLPDSAAAQAGIEGGDRILALNEQSIETNEDLDATLRTLEDREVRVTLADGETTTVQRSLLVTGVIGESPFTGMVDTRARIRAVNGTVVNTEPQLRAAIASREIVQLETSDGTVATGPAGAAVRILENGPAASAGVPGGAWGVITQIGDERVVSAEDLRLVLADTNPGEAVEVTMYRDGVRRTYSIVLGENPQTSAGFIGVDVAPGISGLVVNDFGARLYPAATYLQLLGGDGGTGSFFRTIVNSLFLPFIAATSPLPYNFAGFTGGIADFFVVEGLLAPFEVGVFLFANILFWTAWINLNLGLFNCIPAFPLDGGHILRTSTEAIIARLPVQRRRGLTTIVTTSVGLIMLASLLFAFFGHQLLT